VCAATRRVTLPRMAEESLTNTSLRLAPKTLDRASALALRLASPLRQITPSEVLRRAVALGLDQLEREADGGRRVKG
jgi:hypothetical protein